VAELIDPQEQEVEGAVDITQEQETQEVEQTPEPVAQEETSVEEVVPPKYKGKSLDEIIRMHQEAEKLIGRQAQEVGEVRKLADELIKRQLETKKEEVPATKEDEIDFFEDPKKYVNKAVEQHPVVKEAREQAFEIKRMQTLNRLKTEFPDFESTVADPTFAEWVKASPVRLRLYAAADAEMDFDSAAELLNTWNYVKPKAAPKAAAPSPEVKAAQKAAVKQATVDVLEDPDRYYSLQDEILAAYAEGRVK